MLARPTATEQDIYRLLGEVDPLIAARILAVGPSVDELDEAIREIQDEAGFDQPRAPSSARVANVRAILAELAAVDLEEQMEGELR